MLVAESAVELLGCTACGCAVGKCVQDPNGPIRDAVAVQDLAEQLARDALR
jgi:hypothetical protein